MTRYDLVSDLYARALLILRSFWGQLLALGPMWLLGIALGSVLAWWIRARRRSWGALDRLGIMPWPLGLMLGALLGLVSPLSLLSLAGSIRVLAGNRRTAPLALGLALANPLLSPAIASFTALALGVDMLWWRIIAAVCAVMISGSLLLVSPSGLPISASESTAEAMTDGDPTVNWRALGHRFLRDLWTYGRYFLLALLVSAWLDVLMPVRALVGWLGAGSALSVPLAIVLSGPTYVCGGGAVAITSELYAQGVGRGAVLAYLAFGPATTVRTVTGWVAIGGRRLARVAVLSNLAAAIAIGYWVAIGSGG